MRTMLIADPCFELSGRVVSLAEGSAIDSGNTAWILASAALVLMMTPALALFYGGMVRGKNVLSTLMHSFIIIALISVQWVLWGYSLAFGPDKGGIIGGLEWFGLEGVGIGPSPYAPTIPHQAFMIYQAMFAIITPALISGSFAERIKFKSFIIFTLLWATFVYDPMCHWVWGDGGWLKNMGVLDFAGGTVVHISSGVAALAATMIVKPRRNLDTEAAESHNIPFTVAGAGLLWFGWFGFNAGSSLAADGLATSAFVVTNTSAAMGALAWMTMSWWQGGKPSVLGAVSGSIAGLGAITPASGFVTAPAAMVIGMVAGIICYWACRLRSRIGFDDALDVWGVHGVGGTWGVIAAGLFATVIYNTAGANGLFYGNPSQLWVQLIAAAVSWVYSFTMTVIILLVVRAIFGLNVEAEDEAVGLDISQHGEPAYQP
jgi:ammonium transporter, Amt family